MADRDLKIFAAPLQGFTERPWRQAHASVAGGIDRYFAPFSRVERGEVRRRDIRDVADDPGVTAQAIFRDVDELRVIVDALRASGVSKIDLNMGCPFPPQVRKGRGAAMVERPDQLRRVAELLIEYPDVEFSAKMRLGTEDACGWRKSADVISGMPLKFIAVHPRVARQQYSGDLHLDEFGRLLEGIGRPVVFNGDIVTPDDIDRVVELFPPIFGVMIGRGLLARPLIAREWRNGREAAESEQLQAVLSIHGSIFAHYSSTLCGDSQILQKVKPFWDYPGSRLPHRIAKAIRKSASLGAYKEAIEALSRELGELK